MSTRRTLRQLGREWLVALMAYALLVAPFGCEFQGGLLDLLDPPTGNGGANGLNPNSTGLFLNSDLDDPLIAAARNSAGDAFFVYGARTGGGGIARIDSVVAQTAAGERSFITFETFNVGLLSAIGVEGEVSLPVHLEGANGDYIHITYEETSASRFAATAQIYDAATGQTDTQVADVDLEAAVAAAADALSTAAGQALDVPDKPPGTEKMLNRALGPLLWAVLVVPLVILSQLMVVVMGQIVQTVFAVVVASVQMAMVAALAPLFLFSGLLSEVTLEVESGPILEVFVELPEPPLVDIIIE